MDNLVGKMLSKKNVKKKKKKKKESGIVVNACNPNTSETRTGVSEVQGHPWLHSKFQVSLSHINTISKQTNKQIKHTYTHGR